MYVSVQNISKLYKLKGVVMERVAGTRMKNSEAYNTPEHVGSICRREYLL